MNVSLSMIICANQLPPWNKFFRSGYLGDYACKM